MRMCAPFGDPPRCYHARVVHGLASARGQRNPRRCGCGSRRLGDEGGAVTRQDHEPPSAIDRWGWRYHHTGIPTEQRRDGERYLPQFKMYVSGFPDSPYGVEWMRFETDSSISDLVKTVPHVAFEVPDIDVALQGKTSVVCSRISFGGCQGSDDHRRRVSDRTHRVQEDRVGTDPVHAVGPALAADGVQAGHDAPRLKRRVKWARAEAAPSSAAPAVEPWQTLILASRSTWRRASTASSLERTAASTGSKPQTNSPAGTPGPGIRRGVPQDDRLLRHGIPNL